MIDHAVVIDAGAIVALLAVAGFFRIVAWNAGPPRLRGRFRLMTAIVLVGVLAITLGLGREWYARSAEAVLDPTIAMASEPGSRMDAFYELMKEFDRLRLRSPYMFGISFDSPTEAKLYNHRRKQAGVIEMKRTAE